MELTHLIVPLEGMRHTNDEETSHPRKLFLMAGGGQHLGRTPRAWVLALAMIAHGFRHSKSRYGVRGFCFLGGVIISGVVLPGCSTVEFAPPTAEVREQLGKTAVTAVPYSFTGDIDDPVKGAGEGALVGAGQGAGGALYVGGQLCRGGDAFACTVGLALGVVTAVPAGVIGGIVGASKAHPSEEVDKATATLVTVLREARPQQEIADYILAQSTTLQAVESEEGKVSYDALDYSDLASRGIDSILEIEIKSLNLHVNGRIDPDVSPQLTVEGRLIRALDHTELYRRVWFHWGGERDYFLAAGNDGSLIRDDLDGAYRTLASTIIFDLFRSTGPQKSTAARPGTTTTIEAPIFDPDSPDLQSASASAPMPKASRTAFTACSDAEIPEKPWVGRWAARTDAGLFIFDVKDEVVRGELKSQEDDFKIYGKVNEDGVINASIFGRSAWIRMDIRGTFPKLQATYPYGTPPAQSAAFKELNGQTIRLCT